MPARFAWFLVVLLIAAPAAAQTVDDDLSRIRGQRDAAEADLGTSDACEDGRDMASSQLARLARMAGEMNQPSASAEVRDRLIGGYQHQLEVASNAIRNYRDCLQVQRSARRIKLGLGVGAAVAVVLVAAVVMRRRRRRRGA